jgi:hypothetical protein
MAKNAPALESFNAGELSPDMAGRVTNEKYAVGCDTLQNFIPRIQGGARRRAGTRFVQPVKTSSQRTWLRKFIFSQAQAYQIEFGVGYIRFYTNHGQVLSGGNPYEIASPYTAGMLTNSDNTCGLQIEQSADVLYIACRGYWPMTLKRLAPTNWVLSPYAPPDGPFLNQNTASSPALYVSSTSGLTAVIKSTAPIFDPTDAPTATSPGRLVRIDVQYFNVPTWTTAIAYAVGDYARFNGNTYQALNAATSGPNPPVHTYGIGWDGKNGVQWVYVDSGYGIGQVAAYTSSTQVTVNISPFAGQTGTSQKRYYKFPAAVTGVTASITAITQANPAVVTTSAPHTYSVGDPVYLTGVGGMSQITEQSYVITATTSSTFTLGAVDSTSYSAYTSGGTSIKNASINWSLGAWGQGLAGFTGSFPACVGFFADRLFWAGGIQWWGSAPGIYTSHTQDLFSQVTAACAINGIIASQDVDAITFLAQTIVLLIGTKGGEFALSPITTTQPLGPSNTQVVKQSKWRSRSIRSEIIGTSNFYVQASGKKVLAQDYNFYLNVFDSSNQTRLANHIAGYTVTSGLIDIAWHQEPYETLWGVRNDGVLVGYVFDRQDNVTGWHEHLMGGTVAGAAVVECVSVIPAPDGTRDEVWMIVNRTIGGVTVRSVEYIEKDFETGDLQNSMCYVDMSGVYNGAATTTVTGLSYLNGETVSVLRDGGGHRDCVVSSGQITLDYPGSVVQVGLKCPANLITMDIEGGADVGTAQGKVKRASSVSVRVKNTLGGYVGMAGGTLDPMQPNVNTTNLGTPPPLLTGDAARVSFPGDFDTRCKIQIQQKDPFAMEVLAIFPIITVNEPSPP